MNPPIYIWTWRLTDAVSITHAQDSGNTKRHTNLGLHYIKKHSQKWNESQTVSIYTTVVYRQDPALTVLVVVMNFASMCPFLLASDERLRTSWRVELAVRSPCRENRDEIDEIASQFHCKRKRAEGEV